MLPQRTKLRPTRRLPLGSPSILLTGASGSLGRALALHHAALGVRLNLWGRDSGKLAETSGQALALGASVCETCFDLTDAIGAAEKLVEQDESDCFDIAYLVAGTGETRTPGALVEDPELIVQTAQVNYTAPAVMAATLAGRMAERGSGRIVLIGSAAGHHSLPFASAYASSKAGLARFSAALRIAVKPHGVSVTLAAPGFIDTPVARTRSGAVPFKLPVDEAARRIVRAGEKGARHYVTPWPFRVVHALDRLLPATLRDGLLRRLEA